MHGMAACQGDLRRHMVGTDTACEAGRGSFLALLATLLVLLGSWDACARNAALLVGVSEYPNLPRNALRGPQQDVATMQGVLAQLGFEPSAIRVLADGIAGAPRPTREAIFGAVRQLTEEAAAGDTVVLYLAGHGSVQEARPEDWGVRSLDGLDAIFLPADAAPGTLGRPNNVIVNHEIAGWVRALRAKGVFLWLIVDACHSGYMDRAASRSDLARDRAVPPEDLGIDPDALERARRGAQAIVAAGTRSSRAASLPIPELEQAGDGTGYVGFFAAQSTEKTPEYPMPDDTSPVRGLFTYTLAQAVLANPAGSFAQYRDAVLRRYAERALAIPTPIVVGNGLDRTVAGDARPVRQWRLSRQEGRLVLPAGQLHGVTTDSILAILDDPLAADTSARGFVRVAEARAFDSDVLPVAHRGAAVPDIATAGNAIARVTERAVPLVLRVALPTPARPGSAGIGRVSDAVASLRGAAAPGGRVDAHIQWVEPGAGTPDMTLVVDDTRIWLAGPDGAYLASGDGTTPSIPISEDRTVLAAAIRAALQASARWTNIARLANGFAAQPLEGLDVELTLTRRGQTAAEPIRTGQLVVAAEGDRVEVTVRNTGVHAVDVTVLYVDANRAPMAIFPRGGETARLAPARGVVRRGLTINVTTTGSEKLFVLATLAQPQAPIESFAFLAGDTPQAARDATRGAACGGTGLAARLAQAGFSELLEECGVRAATVDPENAARSWIGMVNLRVGGTP
ncbi:hypothetical protein GXW71_12630 [Roseomonas hellenica]|uniref:Peptidase C14 caspase domain-containing protein n=1 Tax=Plastoroseomonas hellenica TaxID=2687306 RepID=A0ABS5EY25_9PROT|nr:caspase family protein [Plastoroseomonas hellenica]MBR0665202.1 hypothetical protein [Plastoroseomonas hellenica]